MLNISVSNNVFAITNQNAFTLRFEGSTFPIGVPVGTKLEMVSGETPRGHLHAIVLSKDRHEKDIELLLVVREPNDKTVICWKEHHPNYAKAVAACNAFGNGKDYLFVSDVQNRTLFVTKLPTETAPEWTYKVVSYEAILKYICKQMTLEQIDAVSELKQRHSVRLKDAIAAAEEARIKLVELHAEIDSRNREFNRGVLFLNEARADLTQTEQEVVALRADIVWLANLTAWFIFDHLSVWFLAWCTKTGRKLTKTLGNSLRNEQIISSVREMRTKK